MPAELYVKIVVNAADDIIWNFSLFLPDYTVSRPAKSSVESLRCDNLKFSYKLSDFIFRSLEEHKI